MYIRYIRVPSYPKILRKKDLIKNINVESKPRSFRRKFNLGRPKI